jgi:hypothetical protein
MHLRIIFALPAVLLACLPSVSAVPLHSLARRDAHPGAIVERYDASVDLQRRDEYITLLARAKISAAQQAARKAAVKSKVATNQANNKAKKEGLRAQKAAHPPPANKKGRKVTSKPGKPTPPGWRANARKNGGILQKEPKTPKPNAAKGAAKTQKALNSQKAANARTAARKAAGKAKFGGAATAHKETIGLPARNGKFEAPGGATFTGKDARVAVFNSHLNANSPVGKDPNGKNKKKSDRQPKQFDNDPHQVPKAGTERPLDGMKGPGTEYPITAGKPKGYQGAHGDLGSARVITQKNGGVTEFKGVVNHDTSRTDPAAKGFNDHFQVPYTPPPPLTRE